VNQLENKNTQLETELTEKTILNEQQNKKVNHVEKTYQLEISQLKRTVELLTQAVSSTQYNVNN
jgi:hypothetical protein